MKKVHINSNTGRVFLTAFHMLLFCYILVDINKVIETNSAGPTLPRTIILSYLFFVLIRFMCKKVLQECKQIS